MKCSQSHHRTKHQNVTNKPKKKRQQHNDKEIDFVVQKANNEREYYQIAYTVNDEKTCIREISSLKKIKDNHPKNLLTMDFDNTNIDGIQKINVIDWLLM